MASQSPSLTTAALSLFSQSYEWCVCLDDFIIYLFIFIALHFYNDLPLTKVIFWSLTLHPYPHTDATAS